MSRYLKKTGDACMLLDTCRACAHKRKIQKYAPVPPQHRISSVYGLEFCKTETAIASFFRVVGCALRK